MQYRLSRTIAATALCFAALSASAFGAEPGSGGQQPHPGEKTAAAPAPEKGEVTLETVTVMAGQQQEPPSEQTGDYTVRTSSSATRLEIPLRETPQSVSVVTRPQIEDFKLENVNDVLAAATGVVVEKVETDRTYYSSRGFDITNFQLDGIGIPFSYGNVSGDLDTALYDRVEIIRGANGLLSATGNPSATVNFVRKRPTAEFMANTGVTLGSWDNHRVDADVSGSLTQSGKVRGRFIAMGQQADSYLDRYSHAKTLLYGVIEADLGERTLLTLGHSQQDNKAKSPLWGALPLYFSDGSPTDYDRSTSTAADWSRWNNKNQVSFLELSHRLNDDWTAKAIYTHRKLDSSGKLFYAYGTPDRTTGLGLYSYPSLYDLKDIQNIVDLNVNGAFQLMGRKHELSFGTSWSKDKLSDISHYGAGIGTALPDLATWDGRYPEPTFDAAVNGSAFEEKRTSVYAALRLSLMDKLKLILGASLTDFDRSGTSYSVSKKTSETDITPYVGAVYEITPNSSLYASFATIFNPQSQIDSNGQHLEPLQGKQYEVGVKTDWLNKQLNASAALFRIEQDNAAQAAGFLLGIGTYYQGVDAVSQGVELDLAGNVTKNLHLSAGYTLLSLEDEDGNDARTFIPRQVFRLASTYRLPIHEKLKVGMNLSWQDDIRRDQGGGITTKQSAYALINLMARYDITDKISAAVNLDNVTNKKYLTSLYWSQGYYGAPRSVSVSLNWKF